MMLNPELRHKLLDDYAAQRLSDAPSSPPFTPEQKRAQQIAARSTFLQLESSWTGQQLARIRRT